MKIFMSLAALSVATGLWLGAQVPFDQVSSEESANAEASGDAVHIRIAANDHGGIVSAELSLAKASD